MSRLVASLIAAVIAGVYLEDMAAWLGLISSDDVEAPHPAKLPQQGGASSLSSSLRLGPLGSGTEPLYPAYPESLGFFDDIPPAEWSLMKRRVRSLQPNTERDPYFNLKDPAAWFQNNYEPEFSCRHERRIGGTAPRGSLGAGGVVGGALGTGSNMPQQQGPQLGPNGLPLEKQPTGEEVRGTLMAMSAEEDRHGRGVGEGGKWVCDPHRLAGKTAEQAVREEEEREAQERSIAPGREHEQAVVVPKGMQKHHQVAGQHAMLLAPGRTSSSLSAPGSGGQSIRSAAQIPAPGAIKKRDENDKRPPCLVYSVGSRDEFSFERGVLSQIGDHCQVHTFDMEVNHTLARESGVEPHAWGWSSNPRVVKPINWVFKTPLECVKELRHHGKGAVIDVLKLDCDGCEWEIFPLLFEPGMPVIRQLLIELHEDVNEDTGVGTIRQPETMAFFREMHKQGYVIFHKEANVHFWHVARCVEYGFLKLHETFFQGA